MLMPLLDHFHPPLSENRHWESFHTSWANEIMAMLNQEVLPPGYFAETEVHFGSRVEADVATFQQADAPVAPATSNGGIAIQTGSTTDVLLMPAVFPDQIEVQIIQKSGGPTLVGAIELISPRNKDRPEARRAFAAKCAAYLQLGIGLLIIDVVTERQANLHDELIQLLEQDAAYRFPGKASLYSVAYRPLRTEGDGDQIEIRLVPLNVGQDLPTMQLALRGGPLVPVDLEMTYTRTRHRTLL
jgi:hypothetical protein